MFRGAYEVAVAPFIIPTTKRTIREKTCFIERARDDGSDPDAETEAKYMIKGAVAGIGLDIAYLFWGTHHTITEFSEGRNLSAALPFIIPIFTNTTSWAYESIRPLVKDFFGRRK